MHKPASTEDQVHTFDVTVSRVITQRLTFRVHVTDAAWPEERTAEDIARDVASLYPWDGVVSAETFVIDRVQGVY